MFLSERSAQAEYFDAPERTASELRAHYAWLQRINRITRFERPFRVWLPRLLPESTCRSMSVLDIGAGEGELGRTLTAWAAGRGWEWRFTDLDLSAHACNRTPNLRVTVGSATLLPFPDGHFDAVIASTMTHHLGSEEDVIRHFQEAARVSRGAVLICDMQRSVLFLAMLWALLRACRAPREFRNDGLLSVRRGWRAAEWRRLAKEAGLDSVRVWTEHSAHILLSYRRPS